MIQEIWLGDCLDLMKKIPDKSIDCIICDPPYNITGNTWDSDISLDKLWTEYNRIIKPNKAIVIFAVEPFASYCRLSNIKNYKYDWTWVKNRPGGKFNAKNKPMTKSEKLLVFSDGVTANVRNASTKMVYYPQGLKDCNKKVHGASGKWKGTQRDSHGDYIMTKTGYPTDILVFSKDESHLHDTQKPLALCEYLIKTYTKENELVLDNCAGSGTTLLAAKNLNRQYIGIERDEFYYDICLDRLK